MSWFVTEPKQLAVRARPLRDLQREAVQLGAALLRLHQRGRLRLLQLRRAGVSNTFRFSSVARFALLGGSGNSSRNHPSP